MKVDWRPSPNFDARAGSQSPSLAVLHYTAMTSPLEALERLCCPEFAVSAHYLVDESGGVTSLVEESNRAWHAGTGGMGRKE